MEKVEKNLKPVFIWSILSLILGLALILVLKSSAWGSAGIPFALFGLIFIPYFIVKKTNFKFTIISCIICFIIGGALLILGIINNANINFNFYASILLVLFCVAFLLEAIELFLLYLYFKYGKNNPKKIKTPKDTISSEHESEEKIELKKKENVCPYCDIKIKTDDTRCPNCGATIKNK